MNKPFTLKIEELQQNLIDIINKSELPAYCVKDILQKIFTEVDNFDKKEIEKYIQMENEENNEKEGE